MNIAGCETQPYLQLPGRLLRRPLRQLCEEPRGGDTLGAAPYPLRALALRTQRHVPGGQRSRSLYL